MTDETTQRWEEPTTRSDQPERLIARTSKSPRDNECNKDDHNVGAKAEYTDCKNLDPREKSVTKENNQAAPNLMEGGDEGSREYRLPGGNQCWWETPAAIEIGRASKGTPLLTQAKRVHTNNKASEVNQDMPNVRRWGKTTH
ncbi:hypothetical protein mRhiFer1_008079 [Rhinolophus ferrumequinum]|uniref:Uncharacterized protein n=1 Tax=Rhinolophus ferrumequinum TaxID=59479 RepID=A0A7J7WRE5_RHIFE|nr:hypothetical protein mRhiFer1_008079 [Rhinolophus ferrumequinum]